MNVRPKKQRWITDDILELIEQRRRLKYNTMEYRTKQREIKNKIRDAKEKWMTERCREMEELERKHDMFNMYKKVRKVAGLLGKLLILSHPC